MDRENPRLKQMARNAAILLGAFLLGLLPLLVRNIQINQKLRQTETRLEVAQTGQLAALTYLEVSRNNFGLASRHATELYDRLGMLAQTGDEPVRSLAAEALNKRDQVMGMLATADPAARLELQSLTGRLLTAGDPSVRARER